LFTLVLKCHIINIIYYFCIFYINFLKKAQEVILLGYVLLWRAGIKGGRHKGKGAEAGTGGIAEIKNRY